MELKKSYETIAASYGLGGVSNHYSQDQDPSKVSVIFADAFANVERQDLRVAEVLVSPDVLQHVVSVMKEQEQFSFNHNEEGDPILWGAPIRTNSDLSSDAVLCLPSVDFRNTEVKAGVAECPRNKTFFDFA